ncbi:PaaI family thioesterase [Spongorhabdus nitratireducens]
MIKDDAFLVERFLSGIPHARQLGIQLLQADTDGVELELPWSEQLAGNPDSGEIHMGVVTVLLDTICGLSVVCGLDDIEICPTLDLRLDYLAPIFGTDPLYAHAKTYKVTQDVVFTRGTVWQQDRSNPVASATGAFMRMGNDPRFNISKLGGGQ